METNMETHPLELEQVRIEKVLNYNMEINEEKFGKVAHDMEIMATQISSIFHWISSQFGVDLISNESKPYKSISTANVIELQDDRQIMIDLAIEEDSTIDQADADNQQSEEGFTLSDMSCFIGQQHNLADSSTDESEVPCYLVDGEVEVYTEDDVILPMEEESGEVSQNGQNQEPSSASGQVQTSEVLLTAAAATDSVSVQTSIIQPVLPRTPRRDKKQKILRKGFPCQYCHQSFTKNDQLIMHVRTHTGEKPYSCTVCHQSFSTPGILAAHNMSAHPEQRPFSCTTCHKTFASTGARKAHMKIHNCVKPFACPTPNCHLKFRWACHLQVHLRKHTDERPFSCEICSETFRTRVALDIHLNRHRGEKPYSCTQCDSRFFSNQDRYYHETHVHKKTTMNSCDLQDHMNNEIPGPHVNEDFWDTRPNHNASNPAAADFTANTMLSIPSMHNVSQDHMNNEMPAGPGPDPDRDPQANEAFAETTTSNIPEASNPSGGADNTSSSMPNSSNANANAMIKKAYKPQPLPNLLICQYCDRIFAKDSLVEHMRLHTGEKPFRCSICEQGFTQSNHLRAHMRMHAGEKPYGCHLCSKAFVKRVALEGHLNCHRGEKPFLCEVCGQTFYSKLARRNHTSKSHPLAKTWPCKFCGASFQTKRGLSVHTSQHYRKGEVVAEEEEAKGGQKVWPCKFCGNSYQTKRGLGIHIGQHYRKGDVVEEEEASVGQIGSNRNGNGEIEILSG